MRTLIIIVGIATVLILSGCGKGSGRTVNVPDNIAWNIDHGFTCYLERDTIKPTDYVWYCERV